MHYTTFTETALSNYGTNLMLMMLACKCVSYNVLLISSSLLIHQWLGSLYKNSFIILCLLQASKFCQNNTSTVIAMELNVFIQQPILVV